MHDKFILQHEHDDGYESGEDGSDDDDDDASMQDDDNSDSGHADGSSDADMDDAPELPSNETILANKRAHPLFGRLFRSKGEVWLATRPNQAGEWSQAGGMLTLGTGQWVFFDENAVHGIDAVTDSVLLMTIMLPIDTPT